MIKLISLPTLIISLLLLAYSAAMPAKAFVGQYLLQRSWQLQVDGKPFSKPWPWADIKTIAELQVPAYGVRQIVLQGQQGSNLAWAPGLESAAEPGLSDTVISAHRDTHFRFLQKLKMGDQLILNTTRGHYEYIVENLQVVDSAQSQLQLDAKGSHLLLTTCYPFDALQTGGSERLIVSARRVFK